MATIFTEQKLRTVIKESIKEALDLNMAKLRAFYTPKVSPKEQRDIEKRYGRPTRRGAKTLIVEV